jgi:hypothetical protein
MNEKFKILYISYLIIAFLYVLVKLIFILSGYLHWGAIAHGAIVTVPIAIVGFIVLKEQSHETKKVAHVIAIVLPILALVITPIYMYARMGPAEWLTEGRLPVLVIYEMMASLQIGISAFLLWNKNKNVRI